MNGLRKRVLFLAVLLVCPFSGCWSRVGHPNPRENEADRPLDFSIPHQGNGLELRILANDADDKRALDEAVRLINQAEEGTLKELEELQIRGLPPPGPRLGAEKKVFIIRLPQNQVSKVSYDWLELGPQERLLLRLDNASKDAPEPNSPWKEAGRSRGKALYLPDPWAGRKRKVLQGALFYSRECKNQNLPEAERQKKAFDYFVLARNPEVDDQGQILPRGKAKAITGDYLLNASPGIDFKGRPSLAFSFNEMGGRLLKDLTRKNLPSDFFQDIWIKRHLAIVVNGMVVSAPTINSPIERFGQITGNFTRREMDELAKLIRNFIPGGKKN